MNNTSSSDSSRISVFTLLFIILLEGFVTISVEMLTIRQLIPVVGSSVIVTSLIVGIFLLFLALGYHQGGKYTDNYKQVLKNNFTIASVFLGIGLANVFVYKFFFIMYFKVSHDALIGLMAYLLLITSPLVYLLGQTVPITTNLFRLDKHIGAISGKVLSLSTVGSFFGSVFTTLVLMNFLGVAWTVFINALLLFLLVILLISNWYKEFLRLGLLVLLACITYAANVSYENKIFVKTNNYADYRIIPDVLIKNMDDNLIIGKALFINGLPHSFLTQDKKAFPYIEYIKKILFNDFALRNKDILAVGAGGFTLSAENDFGNRIVYVDIDKELPSIAKKGFIEKINGEFIGEDARQFLLSTPKKFDAVVFDVFGSHKASVPFYLLTKESLENVKNVLKENGVAIFNIAASPQLQDNYSQRVDNTIRSVFSSCMVTPLSYTEKITNIIYVCYVNKSRHPDKSIYTDNLNSSTLDYFHSADDIFEDR